MQTHTWPAVAQELLVPILKGFKAEEHKQGAEEHKQGTEAFPKL